MNCNIIPKDELLSYGFCTYGTEDSQDRYVARNDLIVEEIDPSQGMSFGAAITLAKRGKKVSRKGWNGEGQFVRFEEVCVSHTGQIPTNLNELVGETSMCFVFNFKNRHTGETGVQVGWLASQGDMKAEDWVVVE